MKSQEEEANDQTEVTEEQKPTITPLHTMDPQVLLTQQMIPGLSNAVPDFSQLSTLSKSPLPKPSPSTSASGREWTVEYTNPEKITVTSLQFAIRFVIVHSCDLLKKLIYL